MLALSTSYQSSGSATARQMLAALKPFLETDTIKAIELKPGIQSSEAKDGIRFIREKLPGR